MRRLLFVAITLLCFAAPVAAQVIERPVPFDSAARVMVMTPHIVGRAGLRAPAWPVAGGFEEARLYTVTDSSYILSVRRATGVIERYTLTAEDRESIRVSISRLPAEIVQERVDAGNGFIRNQTILGLAFYAPAFSYAIGENSAPGAVAGYLVVAGGTFFAASEIARRIFISRPMNDLSFNTGRNGALAGSGILYLLGGDDNARAAGMFVGGLAGTALGLRFGRGMTEAEAVGAGFGADFGALIALGTTGMIRGDAGDCVFDPVAGITTCGEERFGEKAQVFTILASGLLGYPLGVLYPRNSSYNVTPGDIQTLWPAMLLGVGAGVTLLPESPRTSTAFAVGTAGGIVGVWLGDRFLVRRVDHSRTDAGLVALGTGAGILMGAGVAVLLDRNIDRPQLVFGLGTLGGLVGMVVTERSRDPRPDAGRQRVRVTLNPVGLAGLAARAQGRHSILTVRF